MNVEKEDEEEEEKKIGKGRLARIRATNPERGYTLVSLVRRNRQAILHEIRSGGAVIVATSACAEGLIEALGVATAKDRAIVVEGVNLSALQTGIAAYKLQPKRELQMYDRRAAFARLPSDIQRQALTCHVAYTLRFGQNVWQQTLGTNDPSEAKAILQTILTRSKVNFDNGRCILRITAPLVLRDSGNMDCLFLELPFTSAENAVECHCKIVPRTGASDELLE